MNTGNYRIASLTLGAVSVGFFISYPFHDSFVGGLISAGFSAAMIGGLADWFAVTALFRRPLGIRSGRIIRTEIVPQNRERIFEALTDMVQNELLSKDTLKRRLREYNASGALLKYLKDDHGYDDLIDIVAKLIKESLTKLEPKAVGELAESLLKENAFRLGAAPMVAAVVEFTAQRGYLDKIQGFIIEKLAELVKQPQLGKIIFELVNAALEEYGQGKEHRKLVSSMVGLTPIKIAESIQDWLIDYLEEINDSPTHPVRKALINWSINSANKLQTSVVQQKRLEIWLGKLLGERLKISSQVEVFITALDGESKDQLAKTITSLAETRILLLLDQLNNSAPHRQKLDRMLKMLVLDFVESRHDEIGSMVLQSLNRFDNQELVNLIEDKAGNDLQMIRLNGSIIGGLAGIALYLLTYWFI